MFSYVLDGMVVSQPSYSYVENLFPNVMVFGGGSFGR